MKTKITKPFKPTKITKAHIKRKIKQAIQVLNQSVILKLAPSPIHGVGVFAMRDINKNTRLYADVVPNAFDVPFKRFKELRPEVAELLLSHWPRIASNQVFLYPDTKRTSYINHSDNPNYDATTDKTTRKVKEGEEITQNYRLIDNWQKAFPWLDIKS